MASDNPTRSPDTDISAKTVITEPATPPRLITLILLSALAVLPVNMILPSLPNIAATFRADFALVNLSVAGFAIITAVIEAIGGALSDRFGRRPVVLISLSIFVAASTGCALAPNIGTFLLFRAMQACIGPCYSVALVIIKETSDEREAASKFGYLAMGWALAPMVGALFGGSLDELFGCRSSFVVFAILGAAAFALSMREIRRIPLPRSNRNYLASYRVPPIGCLLSAAPAFSTVLGLHTVHGVLNGGVLCVPGRRTIGRR